MWTEEQMKVWDRLKDKGLEFDGWGFQKGKRGVYVRINAVPGAVEDLDYLFGDCYGVE